MLDKIVDWLKLPTKAVGAVFVASAGFLMLPAVALQRLGLDAVAPVIRPYVAFAGLLSSSVLFVELIVAGSARFTSRRAKRKAEAAVLRKLQMLNGNERTLLSRMSDPEACPYRTNVDYPDAFVLEREQILTRVLDKPNRFGSLWWTLTPTARKLLALHPECVAPNASANAP